ncbi:MAG: hypothetical protein ACTSX6_11150 [Candidatus Heimdallarchaeaceae archaeon]
MNEEKIPFERIVEIAKDVTKRYSFGDLPSLEQISWAFPIEGRDRVYYQREGYMKRIPNTQEGNAMNELMHFRLFDKMLKYLSEGRKCFRGQVIPNHTMPVGDAEDGAYLVYPYLNHKNALDGKEGTAMQKGFFWKTMPEDLVKTVLRLEGTGRGKKVDEWGETVDRIGNSAYVSEELTKEYLENVRQASEIGKSHLNNILQQKGQADRYDQLVVDAKPELWTPGTEFQNVFYRDNEPRILLGKVVKNHGDKIELTSKGNNEDYSEETGIWSTDRFRKFGEHGMVWRVVPAKQD